MAALSASFARLASLSRNELKVIRSFASAAGNQNKPSSSAAATVPKQENEKPVGPGASKSGAYKNPEYYQHNEMTFYDVEVEMAKHRLPQPSSKK